MDRLTTKLGNKLIIPNIPTNVRTVNELKQYTNTVKMYEKFAIKLAKYEDTGLQPEDIELLLQQFN